MQIESEIHTKLAKSFTPSHIEVVNESDGHNVAPGSETHFKVVLVSDSFEGKRAVARHQQVYSVLAQELKGGVHALALHTFTPSEWASTGSAPNSPQCMGGEK